MTKIRKAMLEDAEQIAKVHVESWLSTYKNIVREEDLKQAVSFENRKVLWETILKTQKNKQILFVAENEKNEVVGFISGGKERSKKFDYDGEIYAIYILKDEQGKGIGAKLLNAFMSACKEIGYESVLVWVLTANPSSKFYEHFGAKPIDAEEITIGEGTYKETAYGWETI
jgi:L-amino acid N-acyltransferase YncA